ncbi:hypothetical protein [Pseudonocardia phyllosphaerae]|uniref:hypothetical protein n=1 Tax=Pseudonocardia phyllosphaerae TaxID=3390502 RepID=UPI00397A09CD
MALANILSEMPDLLERTLNEHVPDAQGFCTECRDATGVSAAWPCVTREVAEQAQGMNGSGTTGNDAAGSGAVSAGSVPAGAAAGTAPAAGRHRNP